MTPLSLRAYAKRRGVSVMAVSRAVTAGRLDRSVTRDERGQPKISDPELADREWEAATDHSKAPAYVKEREAARAREGAVAPEAERGGPSAVVVRATAPKSEHEEEQVEIRDGMSLAEASAAEKIWRARLAELKFRQESGELVPAAAMGAKMFDAYTRAKTKLLGIPSRARQQDPGLSQGQLALLESLIREALEELAAEAPA